MADVISELAGTSGVSLDMAKKGMGTVLSFLRGKLPAEAFAKVSNAVPDADGLMAVAEADQGEAGGKGMLGAVTGLAGKLLGGGTGGGRWYRSSRKWAYRLNNSRGSSRTCSISSKARCRTMS